MIEELMMIKRPIDVEDYSEMLEPKVTLISYTKNPIETLVKMWISSRGESILKNKDEQEQIFKMLLETDIPLIESINLIFLLENVSISWREQAVRHRIGSKMGSNYGVDIIPDLTDSMWWSESMRIKDMGEFATLRRFRIPDSIKESVDMDILTSYISCMYVIEKTYNYLVSNGIPREDARELIPLCAHHRITWSMNLKSFKHIINKRTCWILQADLWMPIIIQMCQEVSKISDVIKEIILPPCFKNGVFKECVYWHENVRRIAGEDKMLPCPLYLLQDKDFGKMESLDVLSDKCWNTCLSVNNNYIANSGINKETWNHWYLERLMLYSTIWINKFLI